MKNIFINNLEDGMSLFGELFAVKAYKKMTTRQDKPYIDIELSDKTGNVRGKIWPDHMDKTETAEVGDIVKIDATVETYNEALQLRVIGLSKEKDFEISDFQSVSKKDVNKMISKVNDTIDSIKNIHLKKLLLNVFTPDFLKDFSEASASYRLHHAYKSGLIEHTTEMLTLADAILACYPKMNKDLLRTGVLLHDIGKIREYQTSTTISISTEGKLLGHIFMGTEFVRSKAPKDMPDLLLNEVLHLILSHHGQLEFGSPILPKTTEALALSAIDKASSTINAAYVAVHEGDDAEFTPYFRHLGTELYRSPYLDNLTNEDIPF